MKTKETTCAENFIQKAKEGTAVYIQQVRQAFSQLPTASSRNFTLAVLRGDGIVQHFDFKIPKFELADSSIIDSEAAFIRDYCLAELYNIISCIGARSLQFYDAENSTEVHFIHESFVAAFGIAKSRVERTAYGRAINVAERILDALDGCQDSKIKVSFAMQKKDLLKATAVKTAPSSVGKKLQDAVAKSKKGTFIGIDVGGTDIKLALSIDGKLAALKEYDWFPASFTRINQLIDPIVALTDLMRYKAVGGELANLVEKAMCVEADDALIAKCLTQAKKHASEHGITVPLFDAIGLSFPDVVVRDKIVGGEVYKTRGIRENPQIIYEDEFRQITPLNDKLKAFVKSSPTQQGIVGIVNDGPMAAFTAAVETAYTNTESVDDGVLAYTLGTELGTGYLDDKGLIPDIPLEVYNFIIDLGSWPERIFDSDDVRSVNNFNTKLSGTLQKYTSQSGAFRLALKYFPQTRPALYKDIVKAGFLTERPAPTGSQGMYVPVEPKDMRKAFLEHLMALPETTNDSEAERIFSEIGEFLAVAFAETKRILQPSAKKAVLFGRMVKRPACFALMCQGAKSLIADSAFEVADNDLATTPLMRELKASKHYTVAQFAQAIGAIHYAAYRTISNS